MRVTLLIQGGGRLYPLVNVYAYYFYIISTNVGPFDWPLASAFNFKKDRFPFNLIFVACTECNLHLSVHFSVVTTCLLTSWTPQVECTTVEWTEALCTEVELLLRRLCYPVEVWFQLTSCRRASSCTA